LKNFSEEPGEEESWGSDRELRRLREGRERRELRS